MARLWQGTIIWLLAVGLVLGGVLGVAPSANAAPFSPVQSTIFLSQDVPTQLKAGVVTGGSLTFGNVGGTSADVTYNAIGFNTVDHYIYGMRQNKPNDAQAHSWLVKVQADGTVQELGIPLLSGGVLLPSGEGAYNAGTFGEGAYAQTLFVRAGASSRWFAIDVTANTAVELPNLATVNGTGNVPPNLPDLIFLDGYVWGFSGNGSNRHAWRMDPATGVATRFDTGITELQGRDYGGQWVYGNGNVGLASNAGGTFQVRIDDPGSASPTFTLVSTMPAPASGNNDATYLRGLPVDLTIVKTGPAWYRAGDTVTYTLTVTNLPTPGAGGISSGFTVTDPLPSSLTGATTSTPGCTITGQQLNCGHFDPLAVNGSVTINVSATATSAGEIENTATVLGFEEDPDLSNNTSPHTMIETFPPVAQCNGVGAMGQFLSGTNPMIITPTMFGLAPGQHAAHIPATDVSEYFGAAAGSGAVVIELWNATAHPVAPTAPLDPVSDVFITGVNSAHPGVRPG